MPTTSVPVQTPVPPRRRRGPVLAAVAGAALIFTTSMAHAVPQEGFADLVDKVKPAVVNIATQQQAAARRGDSDESQFQMPPELRGSPFEDFFRRFMEPPQGERQKPYAPTGAALGGLGPCRVHGRNLNGAAGKVHRRLNDP